MTTRFAWESRPDSRGFRIRFTGIVLKVSEPYLIMLRQTAYAYHPCNPEEGRDLPLMPPRELDCLTRNECHPIGGPE